MKITVEIENDLFKYDVVIAEHSRFAGSFPLESEGLCAFTGILTFLNKLAMSKASNERYELQQEVEKILESVENRLSKLEAGVKKGEEI